MDIPHVFSGSKASFSRCGCENIRARFRWFPRRAACICLSCALVVGVRARAQPLPYPKCDATGIADPVPMSVVREAVRQRADVRWAKYAVGEPIPCADENGRLVCWQVPVALDVDCFPDSRVVPSAEALAGEDLANPRWWGISEFWTFVVSASYSDFPIFVHYEGLPPAWVTSRLAAQKAQQALGVAAVELVRYVFLGRPGAYYVFEAPDGRTISIDADTLQERSPAKSGSIPGGGSPSLPDKSIEEGKATYRNQTQETWGKIKAKALRREDLP